MVSIRHLSFPRHDVFVVWEWKFLTFPQSQPSSPLLASQAVQEPPIPSSNIDSASAEKELVKHTVRFKCIGASKERRYQETLAEVAHLLRSGTTVDVGLFPEPNNPVDAKAIAFRCQVNGSWLPIGYVVREALDDVHSALAHHQIYEVRFGWVKFKMNWRHSGFGWYAGIDVTKEGQWSPIVCSCSSTYN